MKVVAAMGGYKTMLEWLEAKIAEDEEKYFGEPREKGD
jgi:hypothetical protein